MKLIIAGSRTIDLSVQQVEGLFDVFFPVLQIGQTFEIVSGGAKGIDVAIEDFAKYHIEEQSEIITELTLFPADWETHGKAAGPIRNKQMADYADALLLIWDGVSPGSANMKATMVKLGKPIYEIIIKKS